jgi:hypothetical protein
MFEKICIKTKDLDNQKIDIAFLIETMFFYGKVILLAHREEIKTLLLYFGEDTLFELIKSGRLELKIRKGQLGALKLENERTGINLFSALTETRNGVLYQAHREIEKNSIKNATFASRFNDITTTFEYENEITEHIKSDFNNKELQKILLSKYLEYNVPNFKVPNNLEVEIIRDQDESSPFETYKVDSNLDHEAVNKVYRLTNQYDLDYSGYILAMGEAKGDIYIASKFESEIVTSDLYSNLINVHLNELIKRRLNSQENINLFNDYILSDCYTIGDAFVQGHINKLELLKLFDKADKFKDWLVKVPEDKNIIGEYHKAVTEKTIADKLPTKAVRFAIFEAIGIGLDIFGAGGIGTAVASGLSAIDSFYIDKLLGGWKPNQFVDKTLVKKLKR